MIEIESFSSDLAGPSRPRALSSLGSVTDASALVDEPESYASPVDSQQEELDDSRERVSSSTSDRLIPGFHEAGETQSRASIISQSPLNASPSGHIPSQTFDTHTFRSSADSCSSPELSFPPTPRLTADTPPFLNPGYSSVFTRQERTSIYDDLSATLEYDYSQAVSRFSSPPPQDAVSLLSLDEASACDFQPGSSAQTIRAYNLHEPSPSRFPSSLGQDGAEQGPSHMDTLSLSSTTISANGDALRPTSSVSSAYDDDADFLTIDSDSSDEEYQTAPLTRSPSPTARLPPLEATAVRGLPCVEEPELSESSGLDIADRLSRLSFLSRSDTGSSRYVSAPEYVDAAEEGSRNGRSKATHGESSRQGESHGGQQGAYTGYSGSRTGNMGFGGGSGGGRRDRDDDDDRYRRPRPRSAAPDYTSSDTSEDEESSDEKGTPRRPKQSRQRRRSNSSSGDDDVPLAQQIPTAIRAQRTIRKQVRDEAVQKRRARSLRRPDPSDRPISDRPPMLPAQRVTPDRSMEGHHSRAPSTSRAQPVVPELPKPAGRPRTKTLPSQMGGSPFSVGELTKKLFNVQTAPPLPSPQPVLPVRASQDRSMPQSPKQPFSRFPNQFDQHASSSPAPDGSSAQRLRAMRSFHRPHTTSGEPEFPPAVPSAGVQLGRSNSSATRRPQPLDSHPPPALSQNAAASLERAKSTRSQSRRPSVDRSARPSVDRSARPSVDQEARPPMPPMPPMPAAVVTRTPAWQQRVFVGTLQRFCQVEITSTSTARDVLEILQNQAALEGAANGWMMWEVSQDFGMGVSCSCSY